MLSGISVVIQLLARKCNSIFPKILCSFLKALSLPMRETFRKVRSGGYHNIIYTHYPLTVVHSVWSEPGSVHLWTDLAILFLRGVALLMDLTYDCEIFLYLVKLE